MNRVGICLLMAMLFYAGVWAQTPVVQDDFEAGNLTSWTQNQAGDWIASTSSPINGTYSLKHNLAFQAGSSYISRIVPANPAAGNLTWEFEWKNGDYDPSSANRYQFFLLADTLNLTGGQVNGYAVGINQNFANDQVVLYRFDNGIRSIDLIDGGPAFAIDSNTVQSIRVTRSAGGQWELFIDGDGGFNNLVSVGTANDAVHTPVQPRCGLVYEFTSSRAGKLWLDDLLITSTQGAIPQINLSLLQDTVRECTGTFIEVTSNVPLPAAKTFTLSYTGPPVAGSDMVSLPPSVTVPAGATSIQVPLVTTCDSISEQIEVLSVTLGKNGQSGVQMGDTTVNLFIWDYVLAMHYNLLRYPGSSSFADKHSHLRPILQEVLPDILGINEMERINGAVNADSILNHTLNVGGITRYRRAAFQEPSASPFANMLFYNSWKLGFLNQEVIPIPGTRSANVYRLYYKYPDLPITGDTIRLSVIEVHLKAGNSPADSLARIVMVDSVMSWVRTHLPGNCILMGDLNLYTSSEAAYQALLNPVAGPAFHDPVNRPGAWSNNIAYADIHTQSTRTGAFADGGAFGGMDDRFDFILTSDQIQAGSDSIHVVPGSYQAYGQDGIRFNQDLVSPANQVVSPGIANHLMNMSDHLPVLLGLDINFPESTLPFSDLEIQGKWWEDDQREISWVWRGQNNIQEITLLRSVDGNIWDRPYQSTDTWKPGQGGTYLESSNPFDGRGIFYRARARDVLGVFHYSDRIYLEAPVVKYKWQVFPNPTSDILNIRSGSPVEAHASIFIIHQSGKLVYQANLEPGFTEKKIPVEDFPPGIYLISISVQNQPDFRSKIAIIR